MKLRSQQTVVKGKFSAFNTLKIIIKDGIFLLEKHRRKSMIIKKMTFLKVDQPSPFQKVLVQK